MTMRNDATRLRIVTRDPRRPRAVVARQGQVLLDTDFDQQAHHLLERVEMETLDALGSPGRLLIPAGNDGFKVTGPPATFDIGAGRGYLDGWLLENVAACKLGTQPHPRSDTVNAPALIAVKALVRHVDPVEEPVLADAALGDAQASGRSLVDWQIFPLSLPAGGEDPTCATAQTDPQWANLVAASTGTLAIIKQAATPSTDPCSLTPGGGYTRLENLLFRFEVHGGDVNQAFPQVDGPRFQLHNLKIKFSRRNASVMASITGIAGAEFTVTPPALDPRNWFAPGLFAEIVSIHDDVDPSAALAHERLFRVAFASDDRVVLEATAVQIANTGAANDGNWFLRLWDAFPDTSGLATVSAPGNAAVSAEIDTGDGLKIKLGKGGSTGTFRRGDYWTCAARADGTVEWPLTGNVPDSMRPHGPETRYAPVAVLSAPGELPADCRIPFATLSDRALLYRGGDGQGVFAPSGSGMVLLPAKLRVAVMRGEMPVAGATVRWSFVGPVGGSCLVNNLPCDATTSPEIPTDADGLAEVTWAIDSGKPLDVHRVSASIGTGQTTPGRPAIVFSATFETATDTGYAPGKCNYLAGVHNVQDALDTLCSKIGQEEHNALILTSIQLTRANDGAIVDLIDPHRALILNALEVEYDSFTKGIVFSLDRGPLATVEDYDPVVEIEVDLPYPATDPDRLHWAQASGASGIRGPFGFQRIRLSGRVIIKENVLRWIPSQQAVAFIESAPQHLWGQRLTLRQLLEDGWIAPPKFEELRIVCRIRLRSTMIWTNDGGKPVYLNAEHLGVSDGLTHRELLVRERDPQRSGDLDFYIYLVHRLVHPPDVAGPFKLPTPPHVEVSEPPRPKPPPR